MKVQTGLSRLLNDPNIQRLYKGTVALLCHNASVSDNLEHAVFGFKRVFGTRFIKIFGPQHGFATDVQDNMIETDHSIHPFFNIPVYSLYSETRIPTPEMLEGIDHLFIDLQDVGCRMYTYIYTLTYILEACAQKEIEIIVLDRPNPLNGLTLEGNILDTAYASFIGRHAIPVRHGMTMGEVALMHQTFWVDQQAKLQVIPMQGWHRAMYYEDTGLPWLLPSPNLSRIESSKTFPSTVLFEGTQLSEGRGTTHSLEMVGHPSIEPFGFYEKYLAPLFKKTDLQGVRLRPVTFLPTFQKHADQVCGGIQIHITDRDTWQPWRVGQFLMQALYHYLGDNFQWKEPPYEYNYDHLPIDIINGTDQLRHWVIDKGPMETLEALENLEPYRQQLRQIQLYKN